MPSPGRVSVEEARDRVSTDRFFTALQQHGLKDVSIAAEGAKILGYLDTGNFALNWVISNKFYGGWPLGHVTEIFGDPSTGKSYLVARAIAFALSQNGVALLDDTEGAFNAVWAAQKLGVDTTRLAYRRSATVGDHMETVTSFLKALADVIEYQKASKDPKPIGPSILALDSLALLTTAHELEVGLEKKDMTRASEFRTLFRVTGSRISALPVAYIIANHTIANIGDLFNPRTTPGGGGAKFQATVRLDLRKTSRMKSGTQIVGVKVKAYVEKNRLAVPYRVTEMVIPFFEPISPYSGLVPLLLNLGVLTSPGRSLVLKSQGPPVEGQDLLDIDTKISTNKSDFMKQDQSAKELLERYPKLLEGLDARGDLGTTPPPLAEATEDTSSE